MDPSKPPTLNELESLREMLLLQIQEARLMFSTAAEWRATEAAMKGIEELIESAQKADAA